jgi:hypothetical protein
MTYVACVVLMGLGMMPAVSVLIWRRKLETLWKTRGARASPGPFSPSPRDIHWHLSPTLTIVCATETARLRGVSCSLLLEGTP